MTTPPNTLVPNTPDINFNRDPIALINRLTPSVPVSQHAELVTYKPGAEKAGLSITRQYTDPIEAASLSRQLRTEPNAALNKLQDRAEWLRRRHNLGLGVLETCTYTYTPTSVPEVEIKAQFHLTDHLELWLMPTLVSVKIE